MIEFSKFKNIMKTIDSFNKKKRRINAFFEKELMDGSWCILTVGDELEESLIDLLTDVFNCGFTWDNGTKGSDIEWWMYEAPEASKHLTVNDKEIDVTKLKDFYNYLVENKKFKENKDGKQSY